MSRPSLLVPTTALFQYAFVILLACAACSSKNSTPAQPAEAGAAGTLPQAAGMSSPVPTAGTGRPVQPSKQTFSSAHARLDPVAVVVDKSGDAVMATAVWRTTSTGVDLEVTVVGCPQGLSIPPEVLDAPDCSASSLKSAQAWADDRGRGIPSIHCLGSGSNGARMAYSRSGKRQNAWTIGDGGASDLLGRVFVLRDPSGAIEACGEIMRAPDVVRVALPPADQPPGLEVRGAIGGLCLARTFPNVSEKCPSTAGLVSCVEQHCDLGTCLQICSEYTRCLDSGADLCGFDGKCAPSVECAACQSELTQCGLGFCAEQVTCSPGITPDGPCAQISYCCAMQGERASACVRELSPVLASLGGDASCIGDMNDWAVVSSLHVPCAYGDPGQMAAKAVPTDTEEASATPPLADNKAGAACVSDQDCPGGHCEPVPGATASSGGYCTRACNTVSDCGENGQCVALGRDTPKGCLAGCVEQSECRDGFLCTGGLQGFGIALSPSCQPKRAVDHLADDSVGKACSQDAECSGGYCAKSSLLGTPYPGNYCTGRCYSDAECGESGVCLWPKTSIDAGYCLQRCTTDEDCGRDGYGCWTLGDGERVIHGCYPKRKALPDRTTGKACTTDADCGGAAGSCAGAVPAEPITNDTVEAPGNYCTQPCALDAECGAGAQCINYGKHGGICLASCSADAPCRSGYTCFAHLRDGDPDARVCVVQSLSATDQDAGL